MIKQDDLDNWNRHGLQIRATRSKNEEQIIVSKRKFRMILLLNKIPSMKYLKYILLFLLFFSCREKESDLICNQPKSELKSINKIYSQISIDCEGKQFAPKKCGNKEEFFSYQFTLANSKSFIEFNIKTELLII